MRQIYANIKDKNVISIYYLGNFFITLASSLTFATYAVFLYKNGLNLFQINMVNAVFMVSIFILEVPTGAFADAIGRKKSVLISTLFVAVGLGFYPIFRHFYFFLIAEILIAIGKSFSSGSFDAWMVDSSRKRGFTGNVDLVFSQSNIYSKFAAVFGGLIGAYLAFYEIGLPFYIGASLSLVAFVILAFLMEPDKGNGMINIKEGVASIKKIASDSIRYAGTHKVIFWLLIGSVVLNFVFQPLNMYWGPRFNAMAGDQVWVLGWLWAVMSLAMIGGSFWVKYLIKKGKDYTYLMVANALIVSIPIIISAMTHNFTLAISSFMIYEISRGIEGPVGTAYVNKYAEPSKRATILSFESMVGSLGAAIGLLVFGLFAQRTSIEYAWIVAGIIVLATIPIYFKAKRAGEKL